MVNKLAEELLDKVKDGAGIWGLFALFVFLHARLNTFPITLPCSDPLWCTLAHYADMALFLAPPFVFALSCHVLFYTAPITQARVWLQARFLTSSATLHASRVMIETEEKEKLDALLAEKVKVLRRVEKKIEKIEQLEAATSDDSGK